MANANTASGITTSGSGRNQFPTQSVAVTTETILQIGTDSGTNANFFLVAPTGGSILGAAQGLDVNANPAITEISAREYGLPSGNVTDQFSSASWDGHPFKVRISGIGNATAQLAAPVNDTFTTAATGGTLADSTYYYYRVAAINASGGTSLASTETSIETGSTGGIHTVTVKWLTVAGATSYKVYGRSTGAELYMATVTAPTLSWVDTGSVTPAGALPTAATSDLTFNLYQGTSASLASDKVVGTIAAVAATGGAFNFLIEATLVWDPVSKILSGSYLSNLGYGSSSQFTTTTVVPNVVTSVTSALLSFLATLH